MGLSYYLHQANVQNAFLAATLVAIMCGVISPFVATRRLSFAVHGTAELSFTGAAAGLLIDGNAVAGALVGSLVVAAAFGVLTVRERERDASIGVILAFGLGVGVYLLSRYHGFASEATSILFGQIFGVSPAQIRLLTGVAVVVIAVMAVIFRPLLFASVDPEVAAARGVRTKLLGIVFLFLLAITVTEAAQIVGTALVLSLTITPASAAQRLTSNPGRVMALSVVFALISADLGILGSLELDNVRPSVVVTTTAFAIWVIARLATWRPGSGR